MNTRAAALAMNTGIPFCVSNAFGTGAVRCSCLIWKARMKMEATMKIYEQLSTIQTTLKAPKGRYNSFGKYAYRSAEDILEAVKPICKQNECTLTVSDDVVQVGERYYIKATATLANDHGETISTQAFAREDEDKKGMDGSQITGTASSYARKYALNGLFCIDDTKDADTEENARERQGRAKKTECNAEEKTNPEAEKLAARAMCQRVVKAYCQSHKADEESAWGIIANTIGKASKDFTKEDWEKARKIAEAWQ